MAQNDLQSQDPDLQLIAAHEAFASEIKKLMKSSKEPSIKIYIPYLDIINPEARDKAYRDSKPKRGTLTEIAIFMTKYFSLKNKPTSTIIKAMNTQELIAFVLKSTIVASPSSCKACNNIFNNQSKAEVKCFNCGTDLCNVCITEEEVAKVKSIINSTVIICGDCDETIDTTEDAAANNSTQDNKEDSTNSEVISIESEKEKNSSQSSQSSQSKNDEEEALEKEEKEEEFTLVKVFKKNNVKENTTEDKEALKICSFYIQFRCKHGTWGKNCNFSHPKICREFMKKGEAGCDLNDKCEYLHPKMCARSLKGDTCSSLKCHLGHIRGTRDVNEISPKKAGKETTKEQVLPKQDFQKEKVKNSKLIKETSNITLIPKSSPPEISGMEALVKSIASIQEQMILIQKDRETGREEIKNLWSLIQTKTIHQDSPPPPTHHHQLSYSQTVMGTQQQKAQELQGCCRQSPN